MRDCSDLFTVYFAFSELNSENCIWVREVNTYLFSSIYFGSKIVNINAEKKRQNMWRVFAIDLMSHRAVDTYQKESLVS
jgi:hypothetical protein